MDLFLVRPSGRNRLGVLAAFEKEPVSSSTGLYCWLRGSWAGSRASELFRPGPQRRAPLEPVLLISDWLCGRSRIGRPAPLVASMAGASGAAPEMLLLWAL